MKQDELDVYISQHCCPPDIANPKHSRECPEDANGEIGRVSCKNCWADFCARIEPDQMKNKIEQVLELWASKQMTATEAAKELAHEVEVAIYLNEPIIPIGRRGREYFGALLRELARKG